MGVCVCGGGGGGGVCVCVWGVGWGGVGVVHKHTNTCVVNSPSGLQFSGLILSFLFSIFKARSRRVAMFNYL